MKNFKKIISLICVIAMLMSVCVVTVSAATVTVTMNNNGVITTQNLEPGSDMPILPPNSFGESFCGWYTDCNWNDEDLVLKVPETDTTVYARYPTTVIDFNNIKASVYTSEQTVTKNVTLSNGEGTLVSDRSLGWDSNPPYVGFIVPAYDGDWSTPADFVGYKLKPSTKYTVTVTYRSSVTDHTMYFFPLNPGEINATRDLSKALGNTYSWSQNVSEQSLEFTTGSSVSSNLFLSHSKGLACTYTIDKLVIKDDSVTSPAGMPAIITMNVNGTVTTESLTPGDAMPNPGKNELGENFLGWYTDPQNWTGRVDTVPTKSTTVYARYNSVIINFNQDMTAGMNQKGKYINKWGANLEIVDGALKVIPYSNGHGFTLPAYDTTNFTPFVMKRDGSYTLKFYIKAQMKPSANTPLKMGIFFVDTTDPYGSGIHSNMWNGRQLVNVNPSDGTVEYKVSLPSNEMVGDKWFDSLILATRDGVGNTTSGGVSDNYVLYIDKVVITNKYDNIEGDMDMGGTGSVSVKYNTNGVITTVRQNPGDPVIDGIGYAGLKFLGWTSDSALENVITTVPADTDNDGEVVIYGKYNYRMFNANGPLAEVTKTPAKRVNIEADPNSETNMTVGITGTLVSYGFALPNYDRYSDGNFKLKPNTKYFVQYKVKRDMEAYSRAGTILARGDSAGVATTDKQEDVDPSRSITPIEESLLYFSSRGTWVTQTVIFETPESLVNEETGKVEDQLYIFGGGVTDQWEANKLYIDQVIYGEYNETETDSSAEIKFATNGPAFDSIVGAAGDIFSMPADPVNPGYNFLGWYTDKDFTTPYTANESGRNTIPEGGLDLYAKWEVTTDTVTFSNIPNQIYTSGAFQKGGVIENSNPPTKHTAFKIIGEPGNETNDILHYDPVLYNSDQMTSSWHRATLVFPTSNFMSVRPGEEYILKFRYKVVGYDGPAVGIAAYTNSPSDVWVGHVKQFESDLDVITAEAVTTDWVPAEFRFTANLDSTLAVEEANKIAVAIRGGASVYLDDFVLEAVNDGVNVYESTVAFETNGGKPVAPLKGVKYTPVTLPTPVKENFIFNGWFADAELTQPVTELDYPNYGTTVKLYAQWMFSKLTEGFEEFPAKVKNRGFSSAYSLYNKEEAGRNFDPSNVHSGKESVFRDGTKRQDSSFVMVRDEDYKIVKGKTYTVSFWVKPTNITKEDGVISIATFEKLTNVSKPIDNVRVAKMSDLKVGEWNKITYTFTAKKNKATYFGIYTTRGNSMYFDDCEVLLGEGSGNSVGAPQTGDNSINPMFVALAVIIATGALLVIGKKVFVK